VQWHGQGEIGRRHCSGELPLPRVLRLQKEGSRTMPDRDMPASRYQTLKNFVAESSPARVSMHGGLRDRLVEMAVEEWPADAPPSRRAEVLKARMNRRVRGEYGSIIATFVLSILVQLIVNAIVRWVEKRHANEVLIAGWCRDAQTPPAL
jgi:hypothetical protein